MKQEEHGALARALPIIYNLHRHYQNNILISSTIQSSLSTLVSCAYVHSCLNWGYGPHREKQETLEARY